jgi:hypothetical protein
MKKLMMILLMLAVAPAIAGPDDTNEVCKRNALVMIVLKNDVNGTVIASETNSTTMRWAVSFADDPDYDLFAHAHPDGITSNKIKGRATCNGKNQRSSDDGKTKEAGTAKPGEANTFLRAAPQDVGINCWCKMDGPVTSWWTFFKAYASETECAENCTNYCATTFANDTDISVSGQDSIGGRAALFGKIW